MGSLLLFVKKGSLLRVWYQQKKQREKLTLLEIWSSFMSLEGDRVWV